MAKPSGVRKSIVDPKVRTALARASSVLTTPLICGCHASVATKISHLSSPSIGNPRFRSRTSCQPAVVAMRLDPFTQQHHRFSLHLCDIAGSTCAALRRALPSRSGYARQLGVDCGFCLLTNAWRGGGADRSCRQGSQSGLVPGCAGVHGSGADCRRWKPYCRAIHIRWRYRRAAKQTGSTSRGPARQSETANPTASRPLAPTGLPTPAKC